MPSPNERPRIVLRELIWVPQELEYLVVSITIVMMYFGILCIAACLDGNGPLSLSVQRSSRWCTHEFCRMKHQFHCSVCFYLGNQRTIQFSAFTYQSADSIHKSSCYAFRVVLARSSKTIQLPNSNRLQI
ncbi:Hypothetical_protein [Hexamita inflata]|uniref:Hypothetical_protein n=1 Tax=Hexamita inflata TaxID=28002 RepID=A0ABP1GG09_9EUKA